MARKKEAGKTGKRTPSTAGKLPKLKYPLKKKDFEQLYRFMVTTRFYEDKLPILYRQGKLFGGVYRGTGNEALAVGSAYALEPQDIIAPLHRDAGAHLVRGQTLKRMYCNFMGRACGPTRGRDGNVHHGDMSINIIGMISHLGTSTPLAVGAALGMRMQGHNIVTMTYIGDGGSSIGDFHEGLNFAAVRKAPFVLIIENNQFAYSTPNRLQFACESLADRAIGYGMRGMKIFGNDVIEVYQACKEAVVWARAGNGPVLIEAETMRMRGHSEHDAHEYVPKEMLEEWARKDPIAINRNYLTKHKIFIVKQLDKIDEEIRREVDEAAEWAESQPFPEPESVEEGVYYEGEIPGDRRLSWLSR
ncbi:MAG TPA: thiamine pyrophosphate-dependent dehydrogenase E1 component subunit alpha [Acidobacteriota bacterium]|nr:thiamine pyrophosphate-dependent dehydrogenase E1 component subunit alpha [Acidobacteriota bacterium]